MADMSTIFYLLLLFIHCVSPSMERSQQKYKEFTPGTIVRTEDLKAEKRKNNSMVHQRARMMSHSFGIVMDPPIQLNSKSATEIRVKWIGDDAVSLGINPRYLQLFPQLVIHSLPHEEENVVSMTNLFDSLWKKSNEDVWTPPYDDNARQDMAARLKNINSQMPPGLSSDEMITYAILFTWINRVLPPKGSNKSLSHNLHVINQESRYSDFLSMPQLVKISKLLPSELPLAKLFDKGIVRNSWAKAKLRASPNTVLAMHDSRSYVEIVQEQLQWYKQELGEKLTKSQKVPSFIIHSEPLSSRAENALIESLAKDSKNIILVWPKTESVTAKDKNVFFQKKFSRTLYNSDMSALLENFGSNVFSSNIDSLSKGLHYIFSVTSSDTIKRVIEMLQLAFHLYDDMPPYFRERLRLMSRITSEKGIDFIKYCITDQVEALKKSVPDFNKRDLDFWGVFSAELKRALLRMRSISPRHHLNNAMAFEAIKFWDEMKHFLGGTFKLHIISGNDNVFNKQNMKQLASFSRTPAAFKSLF